MLFLPGLNINTVLPQPKSAGHWHFFERAVSCTPHTATASYRGNGLNRKMLMTCTRAKPGGTKHAVVGLFTSQYLSIIEL